MVWPPSSVLLAAACGALTITTTAVASSPTTLRSTVTGDEAATWSSLRRGPGSPRIVRDELARPAPARLRRRVSLLYFAALDEIHYTDDESPARVEFLDQDDTPFTSAWKPNEALRPFGIESSIRTLNGFARSPLRDGRGRSARMALALTTGDNADNQQYNEQLAVRTLLEGGRLDPGSGVRSPGACPAGTIAPGEARRYTGVQDYDDYARDGMFYDPDEPLGQYRSWPRWPGLMDRAQRPFRAAGLRAPSYLTLGNHDRLQQGNAYSNAGFETIATGCVKPYAAAWLEGGSPAGLLEQTSLVGATPPDPARRSLSYPELRELFAARRQRDAHGFGYVDEAELDASHGAAAYYAFTPRRGIRLISLNTVSEGGVVGDSAEGNIDDPQFRWLQAELARADRRRELVVLFAHHPIGSLRSTTVDEVAPPCAPGPGSDLNAGCDQDPRSSRPVHGGDDLEALLLRTPNVVAYVAGHTGAERLTPFRRAGGGGFWQIESGSASDWPVGSRLIELFDDRDGRLSIVTTLINDDSPIRLPRRGRRADGFSIRELASLNRALVFNDFQTSATASFGKPRERNAELLLPDPRRKASRR